MKFTLIEVLVIEDVKDSYLNGAITFCKSQGWILLSNDWNPATQLSLLRFERTTKLRGDQ